MAGSFKKIKKTTLTDSIISQITDQILSRQLELGDRLPSERALAELLGVSRPPVREALHALSVLGLIEVRTGEGTFLSEKPELLSKHLQLKNLMSRYETWELVEARRMLEVKIVSLAAARRTPELGRALKKAIEQSRLNVSDGDLFLEADFKFHMLIAKASRNRVLEEMMWTTRDLSLEINKFTIQRPGQKDLAIKDHQAIMEAVMAGRAESAERLMDSHLTSLARALEYVMGQKNVGPVSTQVRDELEKSSALRAAERGSRRGSTRKDPARERSDFDLEL